MKTPIAVIAATSCLLQVTPAVEVILDIQKDTTIWDTDLSSGAGLHFFAGFTGQAVVVRGLIAFDIASFIPAGATIDSAVLSLYNTTPREFDPQDISIHRLLNDWGEGASIGGGLGEGAGATPLFNDAAWVANFTGTSDWSTPGGDFVATASDTQNVFDIDNYYEWSSAQVTADVQSWLNNPDSDFGWIIRGDESGNNRAERFSSRTGPELPFLTINYTPIPEPSLPLLATLSFLPLALRRRR